MAKSTNVYRAELLTEVSKPVLDTYDQARFALVARDAFYDVRWQIYGDYLAPRLAHQARHQAPYDTFVDWQHQLTRDQEPYHKDIQRAFRIQADNASNEQIMEYQEYLIDVTKHRVSSSPWSTVGQVEMRFTREGPGDDGHAVAITHVLPDGSYDSTTYVIDDELEEYVRVAWRQAFEAMVPLYVETKGGQDRVVWEPWVEEGDAPGNVADALDRLYTGKRLSDLHTGGLGRLVGPVGLAVALLDPEYDAAFWAGEWANEFIARAPDEQTGIAVLRQRAPKLAAAIGEDTYEANPPRVVSSVHTVLAPLSPDQPEAFGDGVWDITFRGDDAKPAQQLLGRAGWRKHGKATAHAVAMRKGRVELQIVVRYKRGRVTIDTQP